MIKTVIFDLGRVIVNIDKAKRSEKLVKNSGKSAEFIEEYLGDFSPVVKEFGKGRITPRQFYEKVSHELNLKMGLNEFKASWCNIFALNDGVADIIKKLKKENYRLVLLSNVDVWHWEYIKNKFNVLDEFDDYALSYRLGCMKPNPFIFLDALKKSKTSPWNCMYFDDIARFIYVARLFGIKSFQYKSVEKLIKDLKNTNVLSKTL
ncbi:HAD family phosphatase [Candidatus Woesearchaeota archaeon]|nr:HAD family phosphatase [Candidatus Woesearchaeota archaeon]